MFWTDELDCFDILFILKLLNPLTLMQSHINCFQKKKKKQIRTPRIQRQFLREARTLLIDESIFPKIIEMTNFTQNFSVSLIRSTFVFYFFVFGVFLLVIVVFVLLHLLSF